MDRRSTHDRTGTAAALLAFTVALCSVANRVEAAPRPLCVVRLAVVPGLAPEDLGPTLLLEQRKRGAAWETVEVPDASDCPPTAGLILVLLPPAMVEFRPGAGPLPPAGPGEGIRVDLSPVDPLDRAGEVARIVASNLGEPRTPVPMVEAEVASLAPGAASLPTGAATRAGYFRLGGVWAWASGPDVHGAGVDIEAGASLFRERLEVGLRIGWEPPRNAATPAGTRRAQAVPIVAAIRGGVGLGRVRLLAGLAAGIEWRHFELQPATRFGRMSRDSVAGMLEGSIEGALAAWGPLRVALAGIFRGYIGGPSFAWNGRSAWEAPAWSAGLALRVGAVFPPDAQRTAHPEGR